MSTTETLSKEIKKAEVTVSTAPDKGAEPDPGVRKESQTIKFNGSAAREQNVPGEKEHTGLEKQQKIVTSHERFDCDPGDALKEVQQNSCGRDTHQNASAAHLGEARSPQPVSSVLPAGDTETDPLDKKAKPSAQQTSSALGENGSAHQPSAASGSSQHVACASYDGLPPIRREHEITDDKSISLPQEIIAGVVHKATKAVLAGSSKCGKSWALLLLGMCIAVGVPRLAYSTTPGPVLYTNFEIMEAAFAERIRRVKKVLLEDYGDLSFDNFEVQTMRGSGVNFADYIEKLIRRLKGHDYSLIIIDPFYKSMAGRDENKASVVNPLCALLDRLAQETGAAVVLAHHYPKGKQGSKPVIDRLVGSGVIARDADTIISLTEHKEENCLTVEFVLRNFPDQAPIVVEKRLPRFIIRDDLDPEASNVEESEQGAEKSEALLTILPVEGLRATEWEQRARIQYGIPRATFYREKGKLVARGKVAHDQESKSWKIA